MNSGTGFKILTITKSSKKNYAGAISSVSSLATKSSNFKLITTMIYMIYSKNLAIPVQWTFLTRKKRHLPSEAMPTPNKPFKGENDIYLV